MKLRNTAIAAALSLMPMGQTLVIGTGAALTSATVMLSVPEKAKAESAEFYFNRADKKSDSGDNYGAISDFTRAYESEYPDDKWFRAFAIGNRALVKKEIKDYKGAISDFDEAIKIDAIKGISTEGIEEDDKSKSYWLEVADIYSKKFSKYQDAISAIQNIIKAAIITKKVSVP